MSEDRKLTAEAQEYLKQQIEIVRQDQHDKYFRDLASKHFSKAGGENKNDGTDAPPEKDGMPEGEGKPPEKEKVRSAYWGIYDDEEE